MEDILLKPEILFPVTLLILSFILKLAIKYHDNRFEVLIALLELPVDILFLSLSFLAAHAITSKQNKDKEYLYCILTIMLAIILVVVWKKAKEKIEYQHYKLAIFFGLVSYSISIFILYKIIVSILLANNI